MAVADLVELVENHVHGQRRLGDDIDPVPVVIQIFDSVSSHLDEFEGKERQVALAEDIQTKELVEILVVESSSQVIRLVDKD